MSVRKNLVGLVFNYLTVQSYSHTKKARAYWTCLCRCSKIVIVLSSSLVSGNTQSCGCYGKSLKRPGNVKHLNSKTKEYNTWAALKDRCYNSKNKAFKRYGGRGIIVCDRWLESFANFLEDMGRKPTPKHSIDRIDNDGNYEPSNCRWATQDEQTNNTSRNVFFSYQGETKSLKEWSKLTSTEYSTLRIRIKKLGPEEALRISFNKQG